MMGNVRSHHVTSCATLIQVAGAFYETAMTFGIELDRDDDGRWLADVPDLPGVMCYGATRADAVARVHALASRVIAERLEHWEAGR